MAQNNDEVVATIENANIGWLNFQGKGTPMNAPGDRNFTIFLQPEVAEQMARDNWFIKLTKEREFDGEIVGNDPYLQVSVKYRARDGREVKPPRIVMIGETSGKRTELDEETVGLLDSVDIAQVDCTIRQYNWEMPGGKSGIKAYLKTMYVTIKEDYLDLKYSGVDLSGKGDD